MIWQYPTRFIENSPIFWADRVQTLVMLLHNDGDDAVPWYQGVEFYLALRMKGTPAPAWMEKGVRYIEREHTELSTLNDKK